MTNLESFSVVMRGNNCVPLFSEYLKEVFCSIEMTLLHF